VSVPAGLYLVFGEAQYNNDGNTTTGAFVCDLKNPDGSIADSSEASVPPTGITDDGHGNPEGFAVVSNIATMQLTGSATITESCQQDQSSGASLFSDGTRITAIQVGALN
jgi:hypothetical protein